jgi:hypothetical protein
VFHVLDPMTTTARVFQYQPLDLTRDEIRLIKLNPSPVGASSISCSIDVFDTNGCPPYVAVSYMWGPPEPSMFVTVSNQGGRELRIRENLHDFLKAMQARPGNDLGYLWIDQLAIDQENVEERNHQVKQMGEIFSKAEKVVIWLGTGDEHSVQAIRALEKNRYSGGYSKEAKGIVDFLAQPYWSRLWVAQEIILAKHITVYCGTFSLEWEFLQSFYASKHSNHVRPIIHTFPAGKLLSNKLYIRSDPHYKLLSAVNAFRRSQCEDPRDKVYGLQGIVLPLDRIPVDYAKTVLEVWVDTANRVIASEHRASDQLYGFVAADLLDLARPMGLVTTRAQTISLASCLARKGLEAVSYEEAIDALHTPDEAHEAVVSIKVQYVMQKLSEQQEWDDILSLEGP